MVAIMLGYIFIMLTTTLSTTWKFGEPENEYT
jgi:hypothetical protein